MDLDRLEGLLSPRGQACLEEVAASRPSSGSELGIIERLRSRYDPPLVSAAVELHELRLRARAKFSCADRMYFTREGLEQASAEVVGRHRARRFEGVERVADLCCGIGGDLISLAQRRRALAVDRDPLHLRMARLNAEVYCAAAGLETRYEDATRTDLSQVQAVFVDPARRSGGRRRFDPEGSSPPLSWCLSLAERVARIGIKAAPGLPLDVVPEGWEVELVSLHGDLKEAVLWSPELATARHRATLLPGGETITPEDGPPVPCAPPGSYLLDPDPAVTRAGAVEELARRLGARKLDPEIAFLSLDSPVRTPFARTLIVEESLPWSLKRLREALRRLDAGAVDVRKRGSAVDVDALRRSLRLAGDRRLTVALTRVLGRPWAVVCSDPVSVTESM